jgi:hypothetical protein
MQNKELEGAINVAYTLFRQRTAQQQKINQILS